MITDNHMWSIMVNFLKALIAATILIRAKFAIIWHTITCVDKYDLIWLIRWTDKCGKTYTALAIR